MSTVQDRQCGSKVKHATYEAAWKAAHSVWRKEGQQFNVYRCPWCGAIHVGHVASEKRWRDRQEGASHGG